MADLYDRLLEKGQALVLKFGGPATIRRYTSDPSPALAWRPGTSTEEDTETRAATLRERINLMEGTAIPTAELLAYVSAADLPEDFVPTTRDAFVRGGKKYAIEHVDEWNPSGVKPVLYILRLGA